MKSKLTIKDIAEACGVSKSTVSKALKDSREIGKATRERIKAFAISHNYKPNSLALKLRSQKTFIIGVIIPEIVHHFFSTVLRGIDEYANAQGYNVMICLSEKSYQKEKQSIETLLDGSVDGILMSLSSETQKKGDFDHLNKMALDGFPLVLFDCISDQIECDKVTIDDELGAMKATEYLIKSGCSRIALIASPDFTRIGQLRKKGYLKALKTHHLAVDNDLIVEIDEEGDPQEQIATLFSKNEKFPDGVLAINGEIFASTAMKVAKSKGLKIPEDISVITFTDGLISQHTSPTLSSLKQNGFEMGQQAVALLIKRIENENGEEEFHNKIISTKLKIRESTRPLRS